MKSLLRNVIGLLFTAALLFSTALYAQDKVLIRGTVKYAKDNSTIPGVSVSEVDKDGRVITGVITDINGNYVIRVSNVNNQLYFKVVGMKEMKLALNGQKTVNVSLEDDVTELQEVEVTARQVRKIGDLGVEERDLPFTVQSISTKELEGVQGASIDDQIQGRLAGVDIVASSGDPGAGMSIRIRGANLLSADSNPLVVIDGVPQDFTFSGDFDFGSADEERYAQMLNLAPEDIKEISVLIDAASTAMWGSRGANGVISITTKRGSKTKPRVKYRFDYGFAIQPDPIPMLNGDQYSSLIPEAYMNLSGIPLNTVTTREFQYDPNDPYTYYNYSNNTDWIKEITQYGRTIQHAVNLSGGGEKAKYYTSVTYYDQTGTTIGNTYKRITSTLNIDYDVSDKLKFSTDFKYSHGIKNSNYSDVRAVAYTKMPNMAVYEYNESGEETSNFFTPESNVQGQYSATYNPVAMAKLATNKQQTDNVSPSFNLKYQMSKYLNYSGQISFSINNEKNNKFLPQTATGRPLPEVYVNKAEDYDYDALRLFVNQTLAFNPDFGKDHKVNLSFNNQISSDKSNGTSSLVANTPSSYLTDPVVPANISLSGLGVNSSSSKARNVAFRGVLFYSLLDRYIFWLSINSEGNSRYGEKFRFGYFPSLSARWRISSEPFMSSLSSVFNELSLKFSYGKSGTPPSVSNYKNTYGVYSYTYLGKTSVYPSSPELLDLRWSTKIEYNLGTEFDIMGRVSGSFNIYRYSYIDQAVSGSVPSTTGYSSIVRNNSDQDYEGWDMTISKLMLYKTKNASIDLRFNIASSRNVLRRMPANAATVVGNMTTNGVYQTMNIINNPTGSFYGYRFKGVYKDSAATIARDSKGNKITDAAGNPVFMRFNYPTSTYVFQPGDARYEDVNHDGNINQSDVVYLGEFNPKLTGGFGPSIRYKDLYLTLFFNFRYGNDIVNSARMNAEKMVGYDNQSTATLRRWKYEGQETDIPRGLIGGGYNYLGSDRFVEDGSFLRLKTVSLRYSFPKKFYQKFKLTDLGMFVTATNLWVLTNYTGADPEVNNYDTSRTPKSYDFSLGINVGF